MKDLQAINKLAEVGNGLPSGLPRMYQTEPKTMNSAPPTDTY